MYETCTFLDSFFYSEQGINYRFIKKHTIEIWFFECVDDSDQTFIITDN